MCAQTHPAQLLECKFVHTAVHAAHTVQRVVVEHHDLPVPGELDIQLHAVAGLRRRAERGQAVSPAPSYPSYASHGARGLRRTPTAFAPRRSGPAAEKATAERCTRPEPTKIPPFKIIPFPGAYAPRDPALQAGASGEARRVLSAILPRSARAVNRQGRMRKTFSQI